jgi:L-rhamnose isomerase/sugar isomerase
MTLQETFARALLVDHAALREAQSTGDVLEANRLLQSAYQIDVRPMLATLRRRQGLAGDPYRAYLESGEAEARASARVGGVAAGWG